MPKIVDKKVFDEFNETTCTSHELPVESHRMIVAVDRGPSDGDWTVESLWCYDSQYGKWYLIMENKRKKTTSERFQDLDEVCEGFLRSLAINRFVNYLKRFFT